MPADDPDSPLLVEGSRPEPKEIEGSAITRDDGSTQPPRTSFRVAPGVAATKEGARYELGSEIARGGLGKVTSAHDRKLRRRVAIKELHERSEHGRLRFEREGFTTARLQHPAIVPVLDSGFWETGNPYLVMKLLEGKTLAEELATRTTTDARLGLLPSLLAVADALGYAHERGVIHRDVKPSNIMIGTHGETVLLDWGVAHDRELMIPGKQGRELAEDAGIEVSAGGASAQLTVAGTIAGTVRYMSPEQARGEAVTPGFDVFSLGATIANVLAGTAPFGDTDQDTMLVKLRSGRTEIPPLPAGVSADLAAIVAKATARAPVARYATAAELATDLRKFIAGQLVSARRYTRRQLVTRWLRRHAVLVSAIAIALVVIAVIAVVAVSSVVEERNTAIAEHDQAVARERELILLQARASLRTDPTATIAWLKEYPADAPHQDEVLAMVDEAAVRGVARHVWHAASPALHVTLDGDAVLSSHGDGAVLAADLASGARRTVANLGKPLAFVRAHGGSVFAFDQVGKLYRIDGAQVTERTIEMPSRATGLFRSGDYLKITFSDGNPEYIPVKPGTPPRAPPFVPDPFVDDENNADVVYGLAATGELGVADPVERRIAKFTARSWVRSADNGQYYVLAELGIPTITLWTGTSTGKPTVLATMRACTPGESQEQSAEIASDGRLVLFERCGTLHVFDAITRRELRVAERVGRFELADDSRWYALGRKNGIELVETVTTISYQLGATAVTQMLFAPAGTWLVSNGSEHGLRVWDLRRLTSTAARLADNAGPTTLVAGRAGELSIRRHLECARWSIGERRVVDTFGVRPEEARDLDDLTLLWALDGAADGQTCVFGGIDGVVVVAKSGAAPRVLRPPTRDDEIYACMLDARGAVASCRTDERTLLVFDTATGALTSSRTVTGELRGITRYRGGAVALVVRPDGARSGSCAIETFAGAELAVLPGSDCRSISASTIEQPGNETGLIVWRPRAANIWTERGTLTIPTDGSSIEVSRGGLVANARDREIEIWDIQTQTLRTTLRSHALAVESLTWSPTGVLASADPETVRLWDPTTDRTRVLAATHAAAMIWSADGRSLFTTDGRIIQEWPVDLARGASPAEVRARMTELTSARIVDGRATTPAP